METRRGIAYALGCGVLVAFAIMAGLQVQSPEQARSSAMAQATQWPDLPRQQALMFIDRYGPPQHLSADTMEWDSRWPWKRVTVSAQHPLSPLTETVSCHIPKDKLGDLARYPHGLMADAGKGELSARSDREELNYLTLNLGMEILTGERSPEDATQYFYKAIRLNYAGKSVPYMQKLRFDVPPEHSLPIARMWFGSKI